MLIDARLVSLDGLIDFDLITTSHSRINRRIYMASPLPSPVKQHRIPTKIAFSQLVHGKKSR